MKYLKEALTFDDVLIVPSKSSIKPSDADLTTSLTKSIKLKIPLISAAMDTVQNLLWHKNGSNGGLGIIHKNFDIKKQSEEVNIVKGLNQEWL